MTTTQAHPASVPAVLFTRPGSRRPEYARDGRGWIDAALLAEHLRRHGATAEIVSVETAKARGARYVPAHSTARRHRLPR
jgi:hypothetical protein